MPTCRDCRKRFYTLEDETEMHECPHCGWHASQDREPKPDEDETDDED